MEISDILFANWHKKVWYSHIILLILVTMAMNPVFSRDASSIPGNMETEVPSNGVHGPLVSMEMPTPDDVIRPNSDPDPDFPLTEDGFWDGVEEVDLTLPFPDLFEEDLEDELDLLFNESLFLDIECDAFFQMDSPPRWRDLPPPPLPPALGNIKHLLQNFNSEGDEPRTHLLGEEPGTPLLRDEQGECHLCKWATGGNQTLNYLAKKQSEENSTLTNSMIGSLIGVAFVSAALGAALMSFLLKCKRGNTHSSCVRGSCPVLVLRRNYPKSSSETPESSAGTDEVRSPTQSTKSESSSSGMGWTLKRWRRSSSQAPLNLCSSPGSENSYVEDQYINCDSSSAVYAELNPDGGFPTRDPSAGIPVSHAYSEIPNFPRPSEGGVCQRESKCDNIGYISSEMPPDRNDSSAGSTSTPSSAYYSDVSSCEIATSSKAKTRGRDSERLKIGNNMNTQYNVSSISSHVDYRPVHLNMNAIKGQPIPSRGSLPLSLQLLPKQLNTDPNRILEGVPQVTPLKHHHQRVNNSLHLPQNHLLHNSLSEMPNPISVHNSQPFSPCGHYEATPCGHYEATPCGHYEATPCGHYEGMYEDDVMVIRHCNGIGSKRPLPPLPSRRFNGPKRKQFNVRLDQELPTLSSNYV